MKFSSVCTIAVVAVIAGFIYTRAGETFRLIGDESHPNIFNLFKSNKIKDRIASDTDDYLARSERLAKGESFEQDSSMVNAYYNIVTDFYEFGWGQNFHFATTHKDESFEDSLRRHEHTLADKIGIKSDMRVIDVGSGVGGPARNIHAYTKADITGVSINDYQIHRAKEHTHKANMSDKVHFLQMDFTKLDFPDNTFDAAYSIEATCHATDLLDVYREVYRVLKNGACFGTYEWISTEKYDPRNTSHQTIMRDIEIGSGLPPMHTFDDVIKAAKEAGFVVKYEHDYALDTNIPEFSLYWYHKLSLSKVSTTITDAFTRFMEFIGLAAPGSSKAHDTLLYAANGLVLGGQTGIFTPMHMFVMCKP